MQKILHDTPYVFVPPKDSWLWPRLLYRYLPRLLRKHFAITGVECRGTENLKASLAATGFCWPPTTAGWPTRR